MEKSSAPSSNNSNQTSSHGVATHKSQLPTKFCAISRDNSNISTTSSSNKGEISSNFSATNSVASSGSQLSRHPVVDSKQLLATCSSSTPIRSFQRATISSVVKTRAFDNNPVLQGLLTATPSGQNSVSNSQTPSPLSTPIFSRSRSLRMSSGPHRYQLSPSNYRTSSRTPELYNYSGDSFNLGESQVKLLELANEKSELKENLEFLECERQVLIDSTTELKKSLENERSQWKKELDDLKRQLADLTVARVKAESQLTQKEMELNDLKQHSKRLDDEVNLRDKYLSSMQKNLETVKKENKELTSMNQELKNMLAEKLRYNGFTNAQQSNDNSHQQVSDCVSIVTEMARLRLELNEKDRVIERLSRRGNSSDSDLLRSDTDDFKKLLDQIIESMKGWPEEISNSSYVQNLIKNLLNTHKLNQDELTTKMDNLRL